MKLGLDAYRNQFGFSNMTQTNLSMKQKQNHRKNRLVSAKGAGVGGRMKWKVGISRCTLPYTGRINKALLYSTQNCIQYPTINHRGKDYCQRYICTHTRITYTTEYLLGFKSRGLWGGGRRGGVAGIPSVLIRGAVVSRGRGQHLLTLPSFLLPPGGGAGSHDGKRTAGWGA